MTTPLEASLTLSSFSTALSQGTIPSTMTCLWPLLDWYVEKFNNNYNVNTFIRLFIVPTGSASILGGNTVQYNCRCIP